MKNEEKIEHELFDAGILLKAVHALVEIIGGILAFLITPNFFLRLINSITFGELTEKPIDSFTQYLLTLTHSFLGGTKQFVAFYLLSHGIINLILVVGLFRKKIWAYHASFIVLAIFVLYQMYRYIYHHSLLLIILTIFDLIVIWLIWREYKRIKNHLN